MSLLSRGRLSQRERRADRFASTYYYGLLTRRALTPKVALTRLHVLPRIDVTTLSLFRLPPISPFPRRASQRGRLAVHTVIATPPLFFAKRNCSSKFPLVAASRRVAPLSGPPTSSAASSRAPSFADAAMRCHIRVHCTHSTCVPRHVVFLPFLSSSLLRAIYASS